MHKLLGSLLLACWLTGSVALAQDEAPPAPAPGPTQSAPADSSAQPGVDAAPADAPAAAPAPPPVAASEPATDAPSVTHRAVGPRGAPVAVDPAHNRELGEELADIDTRLDALRAERSHHPIGGPIAMMAAGFGGAALFGIAGVAMWSASEAIERGIADEDEDYEDLTQRDADQLRTAARVSAVLSVLTLGVGIGGSVLFARRLDERRAFAPEMRALRLRRRAIQRELRYGVQAGPDAMGLSLSGRF